MNLTRTFQKAGAWYARRTCASVCAVRFHELCAAALSSRAKLVAVFAFVACVCALSPAVQAQEQGPEAVSSNGVTIAFQNQGTNAASSNGVAVSFQNSGSDSVNS